MAKDNRIPYLLDCYGPLLSQKQFSVVDLYYNEDFSLAEIAENEGITRQGVLDAIKRAEAQLLAFEEKLHFLEKVNRLWQLSANAKKEGSAAELCEYIDTQLL